MSYRYFFTKRKDKKIKNKDLKPNESPQNEICKLETKIEQDVSPSDVKPLNLTQSHSEIPSQSTNYTNSSKKNFEIITSISLELNKKSDNFTINRDNVEFLSVIQEKISYKEKEYKEDEGDIITPNNRQRVNSDKVK